MFAATVFIDINGTLIDFQHTAGIQAVAQENPQVSQDFDRMFRIFTAGQHLGHPQYKVLKKHFQSLAGPQLVKNEGKEAPLADTFWSRELWAYFLLKNLDRVPDFTLYVDIAKKYWNAVNQASVPHEDAMLFLKNLREENIQSVLYSTSDARLMTDEDFSGRLPDARSPRAFLYRPAFSVMSTKRRCEPLLGKTFVSEPHLFINDSLSKGGRAFWGAVLTKAGMCSSKATQQTFVLSNSYATNMCGTTFFRPVNILMARHDPPLASAVPNAHAVVTNLEEAFTVLSSKLK